MSLKKSFLIVFALLFTLGGCSMVGLGYNNGDWLLRYWINDYTSFNKTQKEEIHREVDNYMRWHRQHVLPEYIAWLQNLNRIVTHDKALTAEDVALSRAEVWRLYRLTVTPMIPPAARILSTLDSPQIEELARNFADKNREYRKEYLQGNEQEILVKRADRSIDITENMVGHLDAKQKDIVREMSMRVPGSSGYIDQREARQSALISLLNAKGSEAKIAELLISWTDSPEASPSSQYRQAITAYDNGMNELIAQIFGLLKSHQKHHLSEKLNGYSNDFEKLYLELEN